MSEYENNKYAMTMTNRDGESIVFDVYDLLEAIKTNSPELDHAIKKLCKAGGRGHKDQLTDLKEAVKSIESKIVRIESYITKVQSIASSVVPNIYVKHDSSND